MAELHQFVGAEFYKFKAFEKFSLKIRHFNILVGPNNAGKSTILAAFRILSAAIRKARQFKPELIHGPNGRTYGYHVELKAVSIAEENIFYNYDDSEPAYITFGLSNGNELQLYFPEQGSCQLITRTGSGRVVNSPAIFRAEFNCPVGFVPILGPVEHNEPLFKLEAAQRALFNYQAARNFRNIWHHFPEKFAEFRDALIQTWPGMDIEPPQVTLVDQKAMLHMFCPEGRIPREIFWSGFGFQVWCQMLTHLIQSKGSSLFLIDEPDIYLHSDLQRQLLALLKNLGPDIIIATHSTEIISESDTDEILLINKKMARAKRIRKPSQLNEVFGALGSNLNPVLTQLAKTRRVIFVEGTDFQILGRFAARCGRQDIGNRRDFAVIAAEGFNPERVKNLKEGMEFTLGTKVRAAVIFDRDYRCEDECGHIIRDCKRVCDMVIIHNCKEVENFLLVPAAIDRAASRKTADRAKRAGKPIAYVECAAVVLDEFVNSKKAYVVGQLIAKSQAFAKATNPKLDNATINEAAITFADLVWQNPQGRLAVIPGKEAFSAVNRKLQSDFGVSVTPAAVIEAMRDDEIPQDVHQLVQAVRDFIALPLLAD
jgi:energy-coupling factor transporter ATP-binding protein EcfA2